jgi:hypothetical protein
VHGHLGGGYRLHSRVGNAGYHSDDIVIDLFGCPTPGAGGGQVNGVIVMPGARAFPNDVDDRFGR